MKITNLIISLCAASGSVAADPYSDGKSEGRAEAIAIWSSYELGCIGIMNASDRHKCVCSYAWDFEDDCEDMISNYNFYSYLGGRTTRRGFKHGFEEGVEEVIDAKEEECLDDPDICDDLGQMAANMIADDYCHVQLGRRRGRSQFKEICKESAIDFCKGGAIKERIDSVPNCRIDSTKELKGIRADCADMVDCLLGLIDGDC